MRRREFIRRSTLAAAAFLTLPSCTQLGNKASEIGLQLYTIRDLLDRNPKAVLKKVSTLGYKKLEAYGYLNGKIFEMPYAEFGRVIADLGMRVTSGHYTLQHVQGDKWKEMVLDAKTIGQEYMVISHIDHKERATIDEYKRQCETLNKAGEVCNTMGIRLGYHNHNFEFESLEGQVPYHTMLTELDANTVSMEMDLYWMYYSGQDPLMYFEKYPGRFEQWHVKDMHKTDKNLNSDVGTGTIDFKPLFEKAEQAGLRHFYVEQESSVEKPLESIENSIKYLRSIL